MNDPLHPATAYALSVVGGHIPACKWVVLACKRHLEDLTRTDVWFDEAGATEFFNFCTYLKHYKGPDAGKNIELNPWQKFVFGCVYGWKTVEFNVTVKEKVLINDVETEISKFYEVYKSDNWRFKKVYIEIPRKNGKTTIAAACAAFDALMTDPTGAQVYSVATKEDQAALLWLDVAAYIAQSEGLQEEFEILEGKQTIYANGTARTSFIRPLGSDSKRQDGFNPLSIIADELHAWPKRGLWDVMVQAFSARTKYHIIAITTAGHNLKGVCWDERTNVVDILEGRVSNDAKFGIIYTVPDDQKEEYQNKDNWYLANPNLGCGKQLRYMEDMALSASQIPSELNTFLNKDLNIWTDVAEAWITTEAWRKCYFPYTFEDMAGCSCRVGIDLAEVNDLCAVDFTFPPQGDFKKQRDLTLYYMPKDAMRAKGERDGVSYLDWEKAGYIKSTPGSVTDFKFITEDVLKWAKVFKIESVAFDPFKSREITNSLQKEGIKCVEHRQGFTSMGLPSSTFERQVVGQLMEQNGNPVSEWCLTNTIVLKDPTGLIKPDKNSADKNKKRIDGIVAKIMARGAYLLDKPEEKKENPLEKRGLRTL